MLKDMRSPDPKGLSPKSENNQEVSC